MERRKGSTRTKFASTDGGLKETRVAPTVPLLRLVRLLIGCCEVVWAPQVQKLRDYLRSGASFLSSG